MLIIKSDLLLLRIIQKHVIGKYCNNIRNNSSNEISTSRTVASGFGRKMCGWQIHSYGDLNELHFNDNIRTPAIQSPTDCLIKINATSINPIDNAMLGGYGSKIFNILRCSDNNIEFPLILGRDFAGHIVQKGMNVSNTIKIGDKVWGVIPLHKSGCHAEFVITNENHITHKPNNLDDVNAASILYAGLTAWSGLFVSGQLRGIAGALSSSSSSREFKSNHRKRLCILGAAGGVGHFAVQIAKAENAFVVASCSPDAIPLVHNLGADVVIDYTQDDAIEKLVTNGPFDIILDCAGKGPTYAMEIPWKFKQYITFNSPLLTNIDEYGFGVGLTKNIMNLTESNIKLLNRGSSIKWGYFIPVKHGIEYLKNLCETDKLVTHIDGIYSFEKANEAYERVSQKHLRGKIVLSF